MPRVRLGDAVPVRLCLFQAVCVLSCIVVAVFWDAGLVSVVAGGLAVAVPQSLIAFAAAFVDSPPKLVGLMWAKLVLTGLTLALVIYQLSPMPIPFFVSAAATMVLPNAVAFFVADVPPMTERARIGS